ncbi:MAG: D-alanyl-D-alanine carboxypeptidase [PVC group bacterium]|nr:D-alanyl-D-alanine carboxypeptidase [PVC group bacterium]
MYKQSIHRIIFSCILITLVLFSSICFAKTKGGFTAKSALVMDADKGTIIYQRDPYVRLAAASTVKVLTAVLAMENLSEDQWIVISKRAEGITPTKLYMQQGVKYKVSDMLKSLLMNSANDSGVALAEAISDTEIQFSLLMNERARELGAKNSRFFNATGLPEGKKWQYSTAYDLCLFMKEALRYSKLSKYMQMQNTVIKGTDGKEIQVRNHNKMLKRKGNTLIGKTGYTRRAGHCFLGMFTRGKRRYLIAMQGSRKLWDDLEYLMRQ